MAPLIDTLLVQHGEVQQCISTANQALADGRLDELAPALVRLRVALHAHRQLAGAELYPCIAAMAHAQGEAHLLQLIRLFESNTQVMAEMLGRFFDRWSSGPLDGAAFVKEWRSVAAILAQRIEDEQRTLHPLYERLAANSVLEPERQAQG